MEMMDAAVPVVPVPRGPVRSSCVSRGALALVVARTAVPMAAVERVAAVLRALLVNMTVLVSMPVAASLFALVKNVERMVVVEHVASVLPA